MNEKSKERLVSREPGYGLSKTLVQSMFVAILIGYVQFLRVPELVELAIKSYQGHVAHSAPKMTMTSAQPKMVELPVDANGVFDDNAFMKNYRCNKEHTFRVEVFKQDPLLMVIHDFLAPGEADHLRAIALPGSDN
jgi:hypothetical protein